MATRNDSPRPFMAVHPGMMIQPELEERGISRVDFADMLGEEISYIDELLEGKQRLSAYMALKIEIAIGLPAKVLMYAQVQYELDLAAMDQHDDAPLVVAKKTATVSQPFVYV